MEVGYNGRQESEKWREDQEHKNEKKNDDSKSASRKLSTYISNLQQNDINFTTKCTLI